MKEIDVGAIPPWLPCTGGGMSARNPDTHHAKGRHRSLPYGQNHCGWILVLCQGYSDGSGRRTYQSGGSGRLQDSDIATA
ncbi:MAG: hypothetical protein DRI57_24170 [Deltaproteobacteria bacterium]|nr:MAG: hypothetical protein DRI57_24170 [Deltaproteobacteria bacterium]